MKKLRILVTILVIASMVTSLMPAFAALAGSTTELIGGGWTATVSQSEGKISIVSGEGCIGKGSLKLENPTYRTSTYASSVHIAKGVQVKKGKTYQFEFDAKMEGGTKNASVAFNWNRVSLLTNALSYGWLPFKLQYTPTKDEEVTLRFLLEDKADALWLDNMKFYDVDQKDVNMLTNGDFEDEKYLPQKIEDISEEKPEEESPYMFASKMTPMIDGDKSDWEDIELIPIDIAPWATFKGPMTCGVKFAYDEQNLYFLVDVNDPVHYTMPLAQYWNGDSIQFGIAVGGTTDGVTMKERGVLHDKSNQSTTQTTNDFTAKTSRTGENTVYEVKVPWMSDFGNLTPSAIRFNVLVNNNDDDGRGRYCNEITPGISESKNPLAFKHLLMWTSVGEIEQCVMVPGKITKGNEDVVSVFLRNQENEDKTAEIVIDVLGYHDSAIVPAGETVALEIPITAEDINDILVGVDIICDGETVHSEQTVPVKVDYTKDTYPELRKRLAAYIPEVKTLMMQCEEAGVDAPYETANFAMMNKFLDNMDYLAGYGNYSIMFEYEKSFMKLYHETVAKVNAYLKEEEVAKVVPKYVTSHISLEGRDMYATMENNGILEERPLFLIGYGNWETSVEEIPYFTQLGFNFGQLEVDTNKILVQSQILDWNLVTSQSPDITIARSSDDSVSGENSVYIQSNMGSGQMNHHKMLQQSVKVDPNTTYSYGLKAKGNGMLMQPYAVWFSVNGTSMSGRCTINNSNDWESYDYEFTTGPDQTEALFTILVERQIEEAYIDDAYVTKKGTTENLLKNGNFDRIIQPETEVEKALVEEFGVEINPEYVNWMKKILDLGLQNNYSFNPGLSPNYLPKFILATDPELTAHTEYFLPWNMEHPKLRRFMSLWIQYLAQTFNEYDNVLSINLMNEPALHPNTTEFYLPFWHEYLKEIHGTIEQLNEIYGTDYADFEEVSFPGAMEETPLYYDYKTFTETKVMEFVKFLSDEVEKYMPEKKKDLKIMDYFMHAYGAYADHGSNIEKLAQFVDINACDAFSYYGNARTPLIMKMGWFDYLSSISDRPTWDTESHISNDKKIPEFDNLVPYYTAADDWQGAIHGRNAVVHWLYDLRTSTRVGSWSNYPNANAVHRPADVIEVSRTAMDLNRLAYEVTALKNVTPKVGFLYSLTALGYNTGYMNMCEDVYSDILYSGQKVGFVIDEQPEEASQYELLIVPEAKNVSRVMLENIKKLIDKGGKLLLIGEDCLKYDEYNRPHDAELLEYIYDHADIQSGVREKISAMELSDVTLVDTQTGEAPDKIEYCYTEYDGKILLNIMSYETQEKVSLDVYYKGNKVTTSAELRSGNMMQESVTVLPHQPILLQFGK